MTFVLSEQQIEEAVKMYLSGLSATAIAKSFGVSNNSVSRVLSGKGIKFRRGNKFGGNAKNANLGNEFWERIEARYASGSAITDLADETGVAVPTIRKHLIKRGNVKMRTIQETIALKGRPDPWNKGLTKEVSNYGKHFSSIRAGENNPMFGRSAWNAGLSAENNEAMARIVESMRNRTITSETRKKMSEAYARACAEHGPRHCQKHTEETKQKCREATIRRMQQGAFPQIDTWPMRECERAFSLAGVEFVKEHRVGPFVFDFFLPKLNVLVEVQGDYWHANPKKYKDGPKFAVQKLNVYRDKIKKEEAEKAGFGLLEIWESDIRNPIFISEVQRAFSKNR